MSHQLRNYKRLDDTPVNLAQLSYTSILDVNLTQLSFFWFLGRLAKTHMWVDPVLSIVYSFAARECFIELDGFRVETLHIADHFCSKPHT